MKRNEEVTLHNREAVKQSKDYSWLGGGKVQFLNPGCYHRVWATPDYGDFNIGKEFTEIDRKDSCYFWEYTPNMSFVAGNDLRNRNVEKLEKSYDRALVKISLIIAGLSLLVSIISLYYALWQ